MHQEPTSIHRHATLIGGASLMAATVLFAAVNNLVLPLWMMVLGVALVRHRAPLAAPPLQGRGLKVRYQPPA